MSSVHTMARVSRESSEEELAIHSMFDPKLVGGALRAAGWDVSESLKHLVDIAKDTNKPAAAVAANKRISEIVREVAELNGLIVQDSASHTNKGPNGISTVQRSASRLVRSIQDAPPQIAGPTTKDPGIAQHHVPRAFGATSGDPPAAAPNDGDGDREPEAA